MVRQPLLLGRASGGSPLPKRAPPSCGQVLKLAKKAAKRKQLKRGVKEVVKAIRKNVRG
jgi:hypothetical protein